jgi:hypothetical protein
VKHLLRRLGDTRFVRDDLRASVVPWLVARAVVGAALGFAHFVDDQVGRSPHPVQLHQGLFAWDAAYYRDLAAHGYEGLPQAALRFFPLVPALTRGLGVLFLGAYGAALLVIVEGSALAFSALLHRLAVLETGDHALARRAAWFAAVFPPFAALVLGYADATALALAAGVFLALRTRRFEVAVPLGVLAGLCRPVGVLLVVPALVEAARGWSTAGRRERVARAGATVAPAVGLGLFLAYAGIAFGDGFAPLTVQNQSNLRGRFEWPTTSVLHGLRDLVHADRIGPGAHVVWAFVFLALLVVVARRFPLSYSLYAGLTLLLGLSGHNLDSFERYCAGALPFLLAVAVITKEPDAERTGIALAGAALFGYALLSFLGAYVP